MNKGVVWNVDISFKRYTMGKKGLEPLTLRLSGTYSYLLSYLPYLFLLSQIGIEMHRRVMVNYFNGRYNLSVVTQSVHWQIVYLNLLVGIRNGLRIAILS